MSKKKPTWEDLIWSRDPALLRDAAGLANQIGRSSVSDAFYELADRISDEIDDEKHRIEGLQ